jgi:hypothetical protein
LGGLLTSASFRQLARTADIRLGSYDRAFERVRPDRHVGDFVVGRYSRAGPDEVGLFVFPRISVLANTRQLQTLVTRS